MSWIQDNKGPAAVLGLTGAGVIGLGIMLFNAWSGASAAQEEFDMVNVSLSRLKSTPLAPTNDNLAKKQQIVQAYETAVGKLSLVLYKLQPEDKPTSNTEFQAKLKSRIAEIKKLGGGKLPAEFNLAFDQYTSELPKSDQVAAELSSYLDAVEEIVKLVLKSGAQSLIMLERSPLTAEKGESEKPRVSSSKSKGKGAIAKPAAAQTVNIPERKQVRLAVRADQAAIQTLLSALASPSEMPFFTVAKLVRIENESQIGPARLPQGGTTSGATEPAVGNESAPPAATSGEAEAKPGLAPAAPDSQVVLGREYLRAFLEIDLVKFLNPQTAAAAQR